MIRTSFFSVACLAAVAALLAACATGRPSSSAPTVYDFGLPVTASAGSADPQTTPADAASLAGIAMEVRIPPWFESTGIDYRLAYDDPFKRHEYAASRWSANPGMLLAQRLRQRLGLPDAVSGAATVCRLRIELQAFSQVFDSPQASRGVIQVHAVLVDAGRRRIAERQFVVEQAAATPDARGGVGALVEAGDALGRQLAVWLRTLDGRRQPGPCRLPDVRPGR